MKKFKTIALILSMLILLQGCTVYKSASVSLEQAALAQTKVKLETKSDWQVSLKKLLGKRT